VLHVVTSGLYVMHNGMKTYGEVEVYLHTFLALILGGCKWSLFHHSCFLYGGRIPSTHGIRFGLGALNT